MKKLLLVVATLLCFAGCTQYDDTELRDSISELDKRLSAVEKVQNAYKNNLFITSIVQIENGYTITFSDGSTAIVAKHGDTSILSTTIGEKEVTFVLSDGRSFSIPLYGALSVTFDVAESVGVVPNSTIQVGYTIESNIKDVTIEVVSSADIKAKVVKDDNLTGTISITTGDVVDEYSKVVVFVSNGEKVVMRSITFDVPGLQVADNATKTVRAEGGKVVLEYLTNVDCEVVIPEDAKSWISVVPATRALERHNVILKVEKNREYNRRAVVAIQSSNSALKVEYQIEQEGELGIDINPNDIPDNEIWYTTTDGKIIPFDSRNLDVLGSGYANANANLISNTYSDGIGILRFDDKLIRVDHLFAWGGATTLSKIYFPNSITELNYNWYDALFGCCDNLTFCHFPNNVTKMGLIFSGCEKLETITIPSTIKEVSAAIFDDCPNMHTILGEHSGISKDRKTFVIDGIIAAFAPKDISSYTIEEGVLCIASGTFRGCHQLLSVKLPETLEVIGGDAFRFSGIESISIPSNVKTICSLSFGTCNNLSYVHISEDVQNIEFGGDVFNGCEEIIEISGKYASDNKLMLINNDTIICVAKKGLSNVTRLEIPGNIKAIGDSIFAHIENIEHVIINEGVELIGNNAFRGCTKLKTITIPESVLAFGDSFLAYCPNLEAIYSPNSSIDNRYLLGRNYSSNGSIPAEKQYGWQDNTLVAFAPKGIKEYTFNGNIRGIGSGVFGGARELESVTIKSPIVAVLSYAFTECDNLKTVDLPGSIKLIEHDVFPTTTTNLETIAIRALKPPFWATFGTLGEGLQRVQILVPNNEDIINDYKKEWPQLANQIKGSLEIDYYTSTDYSSEGGVTVLQKATKGDGVDVVLMGDGYSDRQIADGTYASVMQSAYEKFFSVEPYKSHKELFNVYYVTAVSATEGYYEYGNTALSGYFGDGTLVGGDDSAAMNYALNAIEESRLDNANIVVMMNSENYAGTCYMYYPSGVNDYGSGVSVSYFPVGTESAQLEQLLHHEACGHGFAKLADEYAYEDMGAVPADYVSQTQTQQRDWGWWKNVDFTSDPTAIRWSYFINDTRYANEGLGAFEGGLTYWSGVWRPTEDSIMRYNVGGFNAPSREAIYYRIHKLAYGDSWTYDYEKFVEWDSINRKSSAAQAASRPMVLKQYEPTAPPVVVGKSWREALGR